MKIRRLEIIPALDYNVFLLQVLQAEVAESVDALASGASGGNPVEVQVLSSVPILMHNAVAVLLLLRCNASSSKRAFLRSDVTPICRT